MTEKRFEIVLSGGDVSQYEIIDHEQEQLTIYNNLGNVYFSSALQLCELLNELYDKNKKLKQVNEMLQMDFAMTERNLIEENEQLKSEYKVLHTQYQDLKKFVENNFDEYLTQEKLNKQIIKLSNENEQLKKEIYLMHMRSMFSTVKSFKGDVSKRYKYSGETDNIYDAANHYGQYDKILDKKEITMLLNEYETVLNELNEESGHIKNIMREAYLAERTMLGKSVLKQLMERIGIDGELSGID